MNRLGKEKSPYLLQHAGNPVDWYPWGGEAFQKASEEDKPVFLSIGYSTCHWCHVMAHESFEDPGVAAVLNRDFVSVKVDREERPDIDAVYMQVCQTLTGGGGWPLTVLLTPEQKPFWAGTYLPREAAYGRMGLLELLAAVKAQWDSGREALLEAGESITALLRQREVRAPQEAQPDKALLHRAARALQQLFDPRWGGFGPAPKFPTPHQLLFLLQYSLLEQDQTALHMAEHTLRQMYRGGIFDHLGGGFSRYATDVRWLVPHFEKMLYDNALLALAYLEAYQITRRPLYRTVAERTLSYVLRELTHPQGGFGCGQDADSDGVEGKFYVFTRAEINAVLGAADGSLFSQWFGVTDQGNFEGKNILNLLANPQYEAPDVGIRDMAEKLCTYRLGRTGLHKDDKVLTSWNALMIAALARAGWLLERQDYLEAAKKAQAFLRDTMTDGRGGLKLRWREGETAHSGQLDDYAFYAFALQELYRATYEAAYLAEAVRIAEEMTARFGEEDRGGFFLYDKEGEQLIHRPKETFDGALPSGNAVAAVVLVRLAAWTGAVRWQQLSRRQLSFLAEVMQREPLGHSMALLALSHVLYPARELICATAEAEAPPELFSLLRQKPYPHLTLLVKTRDSRDTLARIAPFTESYPIPDTGTLYYLCQNGACALPADSLQALMAQLS